MSYTIDIKTRNSMREKIIAGAKNFKIHLMNKTFAITCNNNEIYYVRFFAKDFQHSTGLLSNIPEMEFFERCYDETISVENILENQKYNISTLKFKTNKVANIQDVMYSATDGGLFMINLHTHTRTYPVAIRNKNINVCVGFTGNMNRARTLRKYTNSNNTDEQLEIVSIFCKNNDPVLCDQLVYKSGKM